jgi:hemerythrin-like metal-binding protein
MKGRPDDLDVTLPVMLGIRILDEEHAELIRRIKRFEELEQQPSPEEAAAELRAVFEFAQRHFAEEETAMALAEYDELETHRKEHQELLRQLERVFGCYESGDRSALYDVAATLYAWLNEHLAKSDVRYVESLCSNPKTAAMFGIR